jgi:hypothetical protein
MREFWLVLWIFTCIVGILCVKVRAYGRTRF